MRIEPLHAESIAAPPGFTPAYAVPWLVTERDHGRSVTIMNQSLERLRFVRVALAGTGVLRLSPPKHIESGQSLSIELTEPGSGVDTLATVRWLREDETEYLWLLSF